MTTFSCTIPLRPVPKGRPFFAKGRAITPSKTREYEKAVALYVTQVFKGAKFKKMTGALRVTMCFYLPQAKSNTKKRPTQTPDLDNLVKGILDALNGSGVWDDDCQVVQLQAEKYWALFINPSITLTIRELD